MKGVPELKLPANISAGPLYREVRRRILQCLAQGEWKPGDRLPNESELAGRFGVAVSTIRAGVSDLVAAGILIRRQGMGTFVVRHDLPSQQFRFSNIYDSQLRKVTTTREIVSMRKVRADEGTAALLGLNSAPSADVYEVVATLRVGTNPVALMELVLPGALFPRLRQSDLEQSGENLYSLYQRKFGITVLRMEERVHARTADTRIAKSLKVGPGDPILLVERVAFTFNNTPVEVRRRTYEGREHHYLFRHEHLD